MTKIHISEEYLVRILINIFHEIKHAKQQYDFFESSFIDIDFLQLYYNYLACLGNFNGYYNPELNLNNYYHNPRELDAEYSGIKEAYNYLKTSELSEKSEILILDYVNSKIGKVYFITIDNPIHNISEVEELVIKTKYINSKTKNFYNPNCIDIDKPMQYCQYIDNDFIFKINECNNPQQQDKLLAGAYIKYIEDKNIDNNIKQSWLYNNTKIELLKNINTALNFSEGTEYEKEIY